MGLEHQSNGQVVEADEKVTEINSPDFGKYRAQVELDAGNHAYFDAISRGADYVSVEGEFHVGKGRRHYCNESPWCVTLRMSGKWYLTEDFDVYWGEFANTGVKISDYDRVNIIVSDQFETRFFAFPPFSWFPEVELTAKWTLGDQLLETDSYDFTVTLPWVLKDNLKIPLYIKAHLGPLNTLSDYPKEQDSLGFGVTFR